MSADWGASIEARVMQKSGEVLESLRGAAKWRHWGLAIGVSDPENRSFHHADKGAIASPVSHSQLISKTSYMS